jgi:hypothetical protein
VKPEAARPLLFEAQEARLAALDALARNLWLGGLTNAEGALEPRLEALAGLRRADDAFVAGVMDLDRYKTQVDRLRSLIELEQSAKTTLEAAADAAKQRGSRADMLREVAASGPAMLATEDTAAANAWLRRYVRVLVRDNQVTDVVFNFW